MCTCVGRLLCPHHQQIEQQRREALCRLVDNKLMALARDWEITDGQWCRLLYLHEVDDLHHLLGGGAK